MLFKGMPREGLYSSSRVLCISPYLKQQRGHLGLFLEANVSSVCVPHLWKSCMMIGTFSTTVLILAHPTMRFLPSARCRTIGCMYFMHLLAFHGLLAQKKKVSLALFLQIIHNGVDYHNDGGRSWNVKENSAKMQSLLFHEEFCLFRDDQSSLKMSIFGWWTRPSNVVRVSCAAMHMVSHRRIMPGVPCAPERILFFRRAETSVSARCW